MRVRWSTVAVVAIATLWSGVVDAQTPDAATRPPAVAPAAAPPTPSPVQSTPTPPAASNPVPAANPAATVAAQPTETALKPPTPDVKQAPAELPREIIEPVERLAAAIKDAEVAVDHFSALEDELARLRGTVEAILSEAQETADRLKPSLADVRSQIEHLGPLPTAGQAPEAAPIAAERGRLGALAAQIDGAIKSTELTWLRARQLIEKITVMRHALFTRNLVERVPSPVLPALWHRVIADGPAVARRLDAVSGAWWSAAEQRRGALIALALTALALLLGLAAIARRLIARGMRGIDATAPANARYNDGGPGSGTTASFFERAVAVAWIAPLRMLPGTAAIVALYAGLEQLGLLFAPWDGLGSALLQALLAYIAGTALIDSALAPRQPGWRLAPFSDRSARQIDRLLQTMVAVFAIDYALTEMSRAFFVPLALSVVQSFVLSLIFAALLMGLAWTPFEAAAEPDLPPEQLPAGSTGSSAEHSAALTSPPRLLPPISRLQPRWLKLPMWALAVFILVTAVLGYVALARFAAHQVVLSGMVFAVASLCTLAIRALTRPRRDGRYAISDRLEANFGIDATRQRQLARLVELVAMTGMLMLAIPVLLVQWGFHSADIQDWFKAAVFGFDIGHFHISLARILLGLALFIGLMFATRVVQKWLREQVLTPARMDAGISNSIDQAIGYTGIALAALVAVSYAGFDITSLAIVAGALSVGIGFGLQSIVNNFVSGLILLVERPIKVGDWIVVGDQQGNVRRISVRSTEIETFDKASLIVPNAELVSGRVLNWTHRNLLGRVLMKFSLDGNADPEEVIRIMLACCADHPNVMATPAPLASLDQFSPTALDFSLRATISDITRGLLVLTDLRIAILKELRHAGQIVALAPLQPPPSTLLPPRALGAAIETRDHHPALGE